MRRSSCSFNIENINFMVWYEQLSRIIRISAQFWKFARLAIHLDQFCARCARPHAIYWYLFLWKYAIRDISKLSNRWNLLFLSVHPWNPPNPAKMSLKTFAILLIIFDHSPTKWASISSCSLTEVVVSSYLSSALVVLTSYPIVVAGSQTGAEILE